MKSTKFDLVGNPGHRDAHTKLLRRRRYPHHCPRCLPLTQQAPPLRGSTDTAAAAAPPTQQPLLPLPQLDTPASAAAAPTNTVEPTPISLGDPSTAKTTITIWHGWSGRLPGSQAGHFPPRMCSSIPTLLSSSSTCLT